MTNWRNYSPTNCVFLLIALLWPLTYKRRRRTSDTIKWKQNAHKLPPINLCNKNFSLVLHAVPFILGDFYCTPVPRRTRIRSRIQYSRKQKSNQPVFTWSSESLVKLAPHRKKLNSTHRTPPRSSLAVVLWATLSISLKCVNEIFNIKFRMTCLGGHVLGGHVKPIGRHGAYCLLNRKMLNRFFIRAHIRAHTHAHTHVCGYMNVCACTYA